VSRAARRRAARRALGAAGALVLDRVAGEPPVPDTLHPVAVLGRGISALESRIYDDRRAPGAVLTAAGVGVAGAAGAVLRSPLAAGYVASSGRALHEAAAAVGDALAAGDLPVARERLTHLVARDPSDLDAVAIARAVVESVAENTTDAVVAPALWTAAAGAVGAFVHRAADTLDSMVGYRDARYQRFGTAAARLDDVLAWGPARATAVLVAAVRPLRAEAVWRTVRADAGLHPSPNAGVAEAAFAAALDVRIGGGDNRYGDVVEHRPVLGDGRAPGPGDIAAAVALSRDVTWALAAVLAAAGAALLLTSRTADPAVSTGFPRQVWSS
jgi:adenosylcobinamide-phosphate synthase